MRIASILLALAMLFPTAALAETNEQARANRYQVTRHVKIPTFFWSGQEAMDKRKLNELVESVLERLPCIPNTPYWRALLFETAMAESAGGKFNVPWRSKGDYGIFQLRIVTVIDTLNWLAVMHPDVWRVVYSFYDRNSSLEFNMEFNAAFGAALCAAYYWRRAPLASLEMPQDRAKLWKEQYNTAKGKGSVGKYLTAQR